MRAQVHTLEQQLRDMYSKVETQQQIQSDDMKRQAEKHLIDRKRENDEHERKLRDLKRKMEEENEMSTRKEDEWTRKQEQLEDSIGRCRFLHCTRGQLRPDTRNDRLMHASVLVAQHASAAGRVSSLSNVLRLSQLIIFDPTVLR